MIQEDNIKKEQMSEQEKQTQVNDQVETEAQEVEVEEVEQGTDEEQSKNDNSSKIEELELKLADAQDQRLRMMAEFDNYRRRTAREKIELEKTAGERIFKDMLPLIDDFERARVAMAEAEDIKSLRDGIELIYQKFIGFLDKNDVRPIDTKDADFDTEYHEAVTTFPAPSEEQKGKVIDCVQRGYTLGEKVIRYAKVVVGE